MVASSDRSRSPRMRIGVLLPTGERVDMYVKASDSIAKVKALLQWEYTTCDIGSMQLVMAGGNARTFSGFNIQNGSLFHCIKTSMQINVSIPDETWSGGDLALTVEAFDTIDTLKEKIQRHTANPSRYCIGIPPELQQLSFRGTQLTGGNTLSDYNIQIEDTLNLRWDIVAWREFLRAQDEDILRAQDCGP
jgi:hypothetical protein